MRPNSAPAAPPKFKPHSAFVLENRALLNVPQAFQPVRRMAAGLGSLPDAAAGSFPSCTLLFAAADSHLATPAATAILAVVDLLLENLLHSLAPRRCESQ